MRPLVHLFPSPETRARLLEVSRGEAPPELVILGARVADVYTGTWVEANLEVVLGRVAYLGPRRPQLGKDTEVVEARGLWVVPGYLEPHAHPWVLYNPLSLLEVLVPQGVTLLIYDDLLFRLHLGGEGAARVRQAFADLPLPARVLWSVRLAPQSLLSEAEEETFSREALSLLDDPLVACSAEITRWPSVVAGEEGLLRGVAKVRALGLRAEAHGAGASYERLATLAAPGLESDHEAIRSEEVRDRLRLGFWTLLRHSSLRPDLPDLLRGLSPPLPSRLMLTTDGAAPSFYARKGFPALLEAVAERMGSLEALRLATLNPATFLGLDNILGRVAPGRLADFLLLEDPKFFHPLAVYLGGKLVAREERLLHPLPPWPWGEPFFAEAPFADPERYRLGPVPVFRLDNAVITRRAEASPRALAAYLLDLGGRWQVSAWVDGLMPGLAGMATTFTASGGLLVLGRDPVSMAEAAGAVARMGGGLAWAKEGRVVWSRPLPIWGYRGYMLETPFSETLEVEEELWTLAREAGYAHEDILYSLALPHLRLPAGVQVDPTGGARGEAGAPLVPA